MLTRFNVKIDFGGGAPPPEPRSDEWLEHRFHLFDRFCFPAVRAQTNSDFRWLVFFDVDTPGAFKKRIETYAQWDRFVPCYAESYGNLGAGRVIRDLAPPGSEFLITTRLDNDDAIADRYVQRVQDAFARQEAAFINFTNGYILRKRRLYAARQYSNTFISLIERFDGFRTVLQHRHSDLLRLGAVQQVDIEPLWLQVIHGRNVLNRLDGNHRVPIRSLDGAFTLGESYDSGAENRLALHIENAAIACQRPVVAALRRLKRRFRSRGTA